jgi:hypothetical protein
MSQQLHSGETSRRKQVKFRADEGLVEEFDAFIENSDEYEHRSTGLKAAMRRMLGDADESDAPREPPADEELRTAYMALVGLANYAGIIPHKIATNELSTRLGKSQELVERTVLAELRSRGYLAHKTTWNSSYRAWKLRGVDE